MQLVTTFDPSISTSGSFKVPQSSASGKIVIYNESNISLIISFQNGYSAYIPAWMGMIYCGTFGDTVVQWKQQSVLQSTGSPLSVVIVETYTSQEPVLNVYPATLARQTNIGNSVSTKVIGVGILVNDGNAAGTQFIEATVSGDSASAVSLTNDAIFKLGTAAHPGSVSFDNATITSNGSGTLHAANIDNTTPINSLGDLPSAGGFTTRFGQNLHNDATSVGFESSTYALVGGQIGVLLKQNNYYDGTNHRFITANPAYRFDAGGSVSGIVGVIAVQTNTNSPSAGGIITWGAWSNIAGSAATSINNTGNTAGTSILQATVSGDGTPAVKLTNDGTFTVGNGTHKGSVSFDNGAIKSDGSGNLTMNNTIGQGILTCGISGSSTSVSNGSTINPNTNSITWITSSSNATNCIMTKGTYNGQLAIIANSGNNTISFAVHSTSNVLDGTNCLINPFAIALFIYNATDGNQWYKLK